MRRGFFFLACLSLVIYGAKWGRKQIREFTNRPIIRNAVQTTKPTRLQTRVHTRGQAAATAAEARAAVVSIRGIGDTDRARAMQQASQSSSSQTGDAPFGAARSWKLREALQRSLASA